MRVTLHLSKFVDWVPVPADVAVTQADIDSGRVKPGKGGGWTTLVTKAPPGGTTRECHLSEATIVAKIVEEKSDARRAGRTFSRREAVAHVIQEHLLEGIDWGWITKVEVHDDGPDEALFHAMVEPHTVAAHGRRPGRMNVPPEHLGDHKARYAEPATAAQHAEHLGKHFGVKGAS